MYKVKMVNRENLNRYMFGENLYDYKIVTVEAESEEQAKAQVEKAHEGYTAICAYSVSTAEKNRIALEKWQAEQEKKTAERKAKRLATDMAKAEAMGMTVKEYRSYIAKKAHNKKR